MCGLAGFLNATRVPYERSSACAAMLQRIRHRGPDDEGVWCGEDGVATLGHRRLAILELSAAGHQPMADAEGRFVLVFNGEIYNHLEIRQELAAAGREPSGGWRGHSDTETLLAAVAAWGVEPTLGRAAGMFALALWDRVGKELVLARDRMGEKPLYYGWHGESFLFASELKAMRVHPEFSGVPDWSAAASFLRRNYIPAPATMYRGTFKLLPGCWLRLDTETMRRGALPEPVRYWSLGEALQRGAENPFGASFEDAVDAFEGLLGQSVEQQSVADVTVGAFLSGGIDSSAVVAAMKAKSNADVMTFSIGMPEPGLDESAHAAAVARHLGTRHFAHEITAAEALGIVGSLADIWDEPFGDSSQIPAYLVSRLASEHVRVALSGDGGDELFLGYPKYSLYQKIRRWKALRHLPVGALPACLARLEGDPALVSLLRRGGRFLEGCRMADAVALDRYWSDPYRGGALPLVFRPDAERTDGPLLPEVASSVALSDAGAYLPDDILVKVDRAAMANSLEVRAPFLDHRIVEFALRLPESYKLHGGVAKRIVREALYRHVPRRLVDRPKMGFSIPVDRWLRNELRPWAESLVSSVGGGGFDRRKVRSIWQEFLAGKRRDTEQVWGMLMLIAHYGNS